MRKVIACLVVLAVLCALAGCDFSSLPGIGPMVKTTAPKTEDETIAPFSDPASKPMVESYTFAPFYAATPEYFYAMVSWKDYNTWEGALYRAPLGNIAQREEILLPEKHEGMTLSRPKICGVTPEWVFVCLEKEGHPYFDGWVVYRVSHETGKHGFVAECHAPAWYNAKSKSLLLPQRGSLDALDPITGAYDVIYRASNLPPDGISDNWYTLGDGTIALKNDPYLSIDASNQVKEEPRPPGREIRYPDRQYQTEVECHRWTYFVEENSFGRNLYRKSARRDLLREKTHIYQLISIGERLFAVALYPQDEEDGPGYDRIMLHELNEDGKPIWNKDCGENRENSEMDVWQFGNMILASQHIYGGGHSEHFVLLYDPGNHQFLEGKK